VHAGELLLHTAPDVAVVLEDHVSRVCAWCFRRSQTKKLSLVCKFCKYVAYCSQNCMTSGSEIHACECMALSRLQSCPPRLSRADMTSLRMLVQTMYLRFSSKICFNGGVHPTESLQSGLDMFKAQKDWRDRAKTFRSLTSAFVVLSGYDFHWVQDELDSVLGAMDCNCFSLFTNAQCRLEVAQALFVRASLFNHSCSPNVARVQRGRCADFYALRDVSEGEALCISYGDPREPPPFRRGRLRARFGFMCACARCDTGVQLPDMCQKHLGYLIPRPGGVWCSVCDAET